MRKFYLISSIVIDGLLSFLLILMLFALGEDEGYYTFIAFMTMPLITLTCMAINIFGLVKNPKFPFVPQHISVRQDCEPSKAEFGFWISVWQ